MSNIQSLHFQTSGEVQNAACECPVGQGPTATCKHIVAILLQLASFVQGEDLAVAASCTETLQTFHRPRKMRKTTPEKASDFYCTATKTSTALAVL